MTEYGEKHIQETLPKITKALGAAPLEISGLTVLKKGMTNQSVLFSCRGKRYILRIPGEGTDKLINRKQEAAVYESIQGAGIGDDLVFVDPETGYKLTEYWEGARTCDPANADDVYACMRRLHAFHGLKLTVAHTFDLFGQIDFYEWLRKGVSVYADYAETKEHVFTMREWIAQHAKPYVLTHIDAVPDNFLFLPGLKEPRLIDWEYAGMQDPDVDIAMFCIYAGYTHPQVDSLMEAYYPEGCTDEVRTKIYGYMAVCGLLWSNWCEYKHTLGANFGDYARRQYDYAKEYSKIFWEKIEK